MPTNSPSANLIYNVNNSATQVLAAKQIKENLFADLLHRDGKGVTQHTDTNVSTIRILKPAVPTGDARELGKANNGAWFNGNGATYQNITEYDLNLLYVYDLMTDIPEVQEDMVPVSVFDAANKNIAGRIATEINASTIAAQLANRYSAATSGWDGIGVVVGSGEKATYVAVMEASAKLDDGDESLGIQGYPFEDRQLLMRSSFRQALMSETGVLLGGSNYAQSMIAKGGLDPEATKEYGNMYCGEIDLIPCYLVPAPIWNRASEWVGSTKTAFDNTKAVLCAASATDRGISTMDYVKVIDSPSGAGKRLQPKVRWGINVCYGSGIVPILASDTNGTALSVAAPGSR